MGFFKKITDKVYKRALNFGSGGSGSGVDKDKMTFMLNSNDLKNNNNFKEIMNDPLVDEEFVNQSDSLNYEFNESKLHIESKDGSNAVILSKPQKANIIPDKCLISADYNIVSSGSIEFYVSRNNGTTWTQANIDSVVNLEGQPLGSNMVLKAIITGDVQLNGWTLMWNQGVDQSSNLSGGREGILGGTYKNRVNLSSDTNTVNIGISEFNTDTCVLFVYQNSTYIDSPNDYSISDDGTLIIKENGLWETGTVLDIIAFELVETTTVMLRDIKFNNMVLSSQLDNNFNQKIVDNLNSLDNISTVDSENFALNRDRQFLYCNSVDPAVVFFDSIDTGSNIVEALVVSDNNSDNISFYLSRDNGINWVEVNENSLETFSNSPEGQQLKLKVEFSGSDKIYGISVMWEIQ